MNPEEETEDTWIDLLGSGEVFRKVLQTGPTDGSRPETNQYVTIKVVGTLENGNKVDCFEEYKFQLGQFEVIQGWELCVQLMTVGERDLLKTFPRFAYGSHGCPESCIPPNSAIIYEIELLNVEDGPDLYKLPVRDRLDFCEKKKLRGNYFFEREEYDQAVELYRRILSTLEANGGQEDYSAQEEAVKKLISTVSNNLGAAYLKIEAWDLALSSLNGCLEVEPGNGKALYRKSKAHCAKRDYQEALDCLNEALQLEPSCTVVLRELRYVKQKLKRTKEEERRLYSKMFSSKNSNKIVEVVLKKETRTVLLAGFAISLVVAVGLYYVFR